MREIKFRAKRTDGLGWAYGYLVKTPITAEFNAKDGQYFDSGWEGRYCIVTEHGVAHEIDIKTVGQYAGLKDKNVKDIYEGDILKVNGVVKYEEGSGGGDEYGAKWIGFEQHEMCSFSEDEIIGNIHENPELIKEV